MFILASEQIAGNVPHDVIDRREQLVNEREIGPYQAVQLITERVARLHAFFFDLDLHLIRPGSLAPGLEAGPAEFYERTARHWLARHPVLADAEVRNSGGGLHIIPWLAEPVAFASDGQRRRWDGIVRAVQAVLPVDPHQPGITGLTRAVGSINSKNDAVVERLNEGKPVPVDRVEHLFEQMSRSPFRTVMLVLLGDERIRPCPVCRADGTTLSAGDYVGFCYGSCGKVKLAQLYNLFLAPRPANSKEAVKDESQ
jgi:hypothetical protein